MTASTLILLRDFLYYEFGQRIAPRDWSFNAQETWEKLQMAIQREIEALRSNEP